MLIHFVWKPDVHLTFASQIINLLAAILLLLSFAMLTQRRILSLINLFALQGSR